MHRSKIKNLYVVLVVESKKCDEKEQSMKVCLS